MKPFLCFFFVFILIFLAAASSPSSLVTADITKVRQMLAAREQELANLVTAAETAHRERCGNLQGWFDPNSDMRRADYWNVPACGTQFDAARGFHCTQQFGDNLDLCGDDRLCRGTIRSFNTTTVLFPENPDFRDEAALAFLAGGRQFDAQAAVSRDAGLNAFLGVGDASGLSRWLPGFPQDRKATAPYCNLYDPRTRPWYTAASSGPRSIVFIVDVSGSMSIADCATCLKRIEMLKDSLQKLLDTLTFNDYFSIVQFHDIASYLYPTTGKLIQATAANIALAKTAVGTMAANGGTVFEDAFTKGFDAFLNTDVDSKCNRVILFLTDGENIDNWVDMNAHISAKQTLLTGIAQNRRKAVIMTFTMGPGASTGLPREIACKNNGVHFPIPGGVAPATVLRKYTKFFEFGIDATQARWSEPFDDAFGTGLVTTTSRPLYDRFSTPAAGAVFFGVAEADIFIKDLLQFATLAEIRTELLSRSATCPTKSISECNLQNLRNVADPGFTCDDGRKSLSACESEGLVARITTCYPPAPSTTSSTTTTTTTSSTTTSTTTTSTTSTTTTSSSTTTTATSGNNSDTATSSSSSSAAASPSVSGTTTATSVPTAMPTTTSAPPPPGPPPGPSGMPTDTNQLLVQPIVASTRLAVNATTTNYADVVCCPRHCNKTIDVDGRRYVIFGDALYGRTWSQTKAFCEGMSIAGANHVRVPGRMVSVFDDKINHLLARETSRQAYFTSGYAPSPTTAAGEWDWDISSTSNTFFAAKTGRKTYTAANAPPTCKNSHYMADMDGSAYCMWRGSYADATAGQTKMIVTTYNYGGAQPLAGLGRWLPSSETGDGLTVGVACTFDLKLFATPAPATYAVQRLADGLAPTITCGMHSPDGSNKRVLHFYREQLYPDDALEICATASIPDPANSNANIFGRLVTIPDETYNNALAGMVADLFPDDKRALTGAMRVPRFFGSPRWRWGPTTTSPLLRDENASCAQPFCSWATPATVPTMSTTTESSCISGPGGGCWESWGSFMTVSSAGLWRMARLSERVPFICEFPVSVLDMTTCTAIAPAIAGPGAPPGTLAPGPTPAPSNGSGGAAAPGGGASGGAGAGIAIGVLIAVLVLIGFLWYYREKQAEELSGDGGGAKKPVEDPVAAAQARRLREEAAEAALFEASFGANAKKKKPSSFRTLDDLEAKPETARIYVPPEVTPPAAAAATGDDGPNRNNNNFAPSAGDDDLAAPVAGGGALATGGAAARLAAADPSKPVEVRAAHYGVLCNVTSSAAAAYVGPSQFKSDGVYARWSSGDVLGLPSVMTKYLTLYNDNGTKRAFSEGAKQDAKLLGALGPRGSIRPVLALLGNGVDVTEEVKNLIDAPTGRFHSADGNYRGVFRDPLPGKKKALHVLLTDHRYLVFPDGEEAEFTVTPVGAGGAENDQNPAASSSPGIFSCCGGSKKKEEPPLPTTSSKKKIFGKPGGENDDNADGGGGFGRSTHSRFNVGGEPGEDHPDSARKPSAKPAPPPQQQQQLQEEDSVELTEQGSGAFGHADFALDADDLDALAVSRSAAYEMEVEDEQELEEVRATEAELAAFWSTGAAPANPFEAAKRGLNAVHALARQRVMARNHQARLRAPVQRGAAASGGIGGRPGAGAAAAGGGSAGALANPFSPGGKSSSNSSSPTARGGGGRPQISQDEFEFI